MLLSVTSIYSEAATTIGMMASEGTKMQTGRGRKTTRNRVSSDESLFPGVADGLEQRSVTVINVSHCIVTTSSSIVAPPWTRSPSAYWT
jgi:hypothetical protein